MAARQDAGLVEVPLAGSRPAQLSEVLSSRVHVLIPPFIQHEFSAYYVPGMILGTQQSTQPPVFPSLWGSCFNGEAESKQYNTHS